MRSARPLLLLLSVLALLAACDLPTSTTTRTGQTTSDSTLTPIAAPTGTYSLVARDGVTPPFVVSSSDSTVVVMTGGFVELTADSITRETDFTDSLHHRFAYREEFRGHAQWRASASGRTIYVINRGDVVDSLRWDGTTLTLMMDSLCATPGRVPFTYRRPTAGANPNRLKTDSLSAHDQLLEWVWGSNLRP